MLQYLIETYGYVAIGLGTFFEGETILVLGGFAAHRGYLHLPWVMLAAFVGSLAGDQLFFYLGRRHSQALLARRPAWTARVERVDRLVQRFRIPVLLSFRFLYGLRTVTPFALGMSSLSTATFVIFNAISALLWSIAVGAGGYLFGNLLEAVLGEVKRYEMIILGGIAVVGLIGWLIHFCFLRKNPACRK